MSNSRLRCRLFIIGLLLQITMRSIGQPADDSPPEVRLANRLYEEGNHAAAAVEYRRLALSAPNVNDAAAFQWAAALAHLRDNQPGISSRMLDRLETASATYHREVALLRAEIALYEHREHEAEFYLEELTAQTAAPTLRDYGARRLAGLYIRQDRPMNAAAALRMTTNHEERLQALERYTTGPRRNPTVGGLLGMIPGLGYAYSGEYANALRSLLINTLFIYGMVDTAQDEAWGAFSVITFFELTWYTGSIYGGVDAAHRFNRRQRAACLDAIEGPLHLDFQPVRLPLLTLSLEF